MNLLQMSCLITWDQNKSAPNLKKEGQDKPYNQTQLPKVNDFDLCFVLKFFQILNPRTNPKGLDF